jgi:single-strand DNA-binding protein
MSVNVISLVGRVGGEVEMRYFESGSCVANCTLAVESGQKNPDGSKGAPFWFKLEMWAKTAEIAAQYVKKGGLIGITGALKFDHWNDQTTGESRSQPIIRVAQLNLLGSKNDNQQPREEF